jgi:hypothetical protein
VIRGKGNLGRDPGTLEFRVVGRTYEADNGQRGEVAVVTGVAPSPVTMADLAPNRVVGTSREPTKAERATEFLLKALADGEWHEVAPIRKRLDADGLGSESVVAEAKRRADVQKRKRPGVTDGPWEWRMGTPDGALEPSPLYARSPRRDGAFDFEGVKANGVGKAPRLHDPEQVEGRNRRLHEPEGLRAGARGPLVTAALADSGAEI